MPWRAAAFFIAPLLTCTFSTMHALYIFNPETEFALAMGNAPYTATKRVRQMRERLTFIQALIANDGDAVLSEGTTGAVAAENGILGQIARAKHMMTVYPQDLKRYISQNPQTIILPWGWNHNIVYRLKRLGIDESMLPDKKYLDMVRLKAHRSSAISFLRHFRDYQRYDKTVIDKVEEGLAFWKTDPDICLKAPWSSSGRGLLFARRCSEKKVTEWLSGVIRDQGSVIIEHEHKRIFDFGAEWFIEKDGSVRFDGFSALSIGERGQYHYNVIATRRDFIERIFPEATYGHNVSVEDLENILEIQEEALYRQVVETTPRYSGPIGIDMFVDSDGRINPCVEMNFRTTMGMIALKVAEAIASEDDSEASRIIRETFSEGRFDPCNPVL